VNAGWEELYRLNGDTGNDRLYEGRSHGKRLTRRRGRYDDNLFAFAGP